MAKEKQRRRKRNCSEKEEKMKSRNDVIRSFSYLRINKFLRNTDKIE